MSVIEQLYVASLDIADPIVMHPVHPTAVTFSYNAGYPPGVVFSAISFHPTRVEAEVGENAIVEGLPLVEVVPAVPRIDRPELLKFGYILLTPTPLFDYDLGVFHGRMSIRQPFYRGSNDGDIPDGDIPDGDIPDGDIPDGTDTDTGILVQGIPLCNRREVFSAWAEDVACDGRGAVQSAWASQRKSGGRVWRGKRM